MKSGTYHSVLGALSSVARGLNENRPVPLLQLHPAVLTAGPLAPFTQLQQNRTFPMYLCVKCSSFLCVFGSFPSVIMPILSLFSECSFCWKDVCSPRAVRTSQSRVALRDSHASVSCSLRFAQPPPPTPCCSRRRLRSL